MVLASCCCAFLIEAALGAALASRLTIWALLVPVVALLVFGLLEPSANREANSELKWKILQWLRPPKNGLDRSISTSASFSEIPCPNTDNHSIRWTLLMEVHVLNSCHFFVSAPVFNYFLKFPPTLLWWQPGCILQVVRHTERRFDVDYAVR